MLQQRKLFILNFPLFSTNVPVIFHLRLRQAVPEVPGLLPAQRQLVLGLALGALAPAAAAAAAVAAGRAPVGLLADGLGDVDVGQAENKDG